MEIRIVLAACVVIGSVLVGKALTGAAHRRVETIRGIMEGLRALRVRMVSMFEPVQHALSDSECPILRQVGRRMGEGKSAGASWMSEKSRLCRAGGAADALTRADIQTLDRLFAHLGESGREAQDILLTESSEEMEHLLDEARKRAGEADRLYVALGLMVGLMLALIVV